MVEIIFPLSILCTKWLGGMYIIDQPDTQHHFLNNNGNTQSCSLTWFFFCLLNVLLQIHEAYVALKWELLFSHTAYNQKIQKKKEKKNEEKGVGERGRGGKKKKAEYNEDSIVRKLFVKIALTKLKSLFSFPSIPNSLHFLIILPEIVSFTTQVTFNFSSLPVK